MSVTLNQIYEEIKNLNDFDYFAYWRRKYLVSDYRNLLEENAILKKEMLDRLKLIASNNSRSELIEYADKQNGVSNVR